MGENIKGVMRGRAGGNDAVPTAIPNTTVLATSRQTSAGQTAAGQTKPGQNSAGQNSAGQNSAGQTSAAQPAQPPNTTQITQSINDWIQDVNTVNNFLDVALALPLGSQLEAGAIKALSFAQNEPTNNKILGTLPGLDASGQAASTELSNVFGDVLVQLQNVVNNPRSLNTALNAVNRINLNRYAIFRCFLVRFEEGG